MNDIRKVAVLTITMALAPSGASAAKLYKCVTATGETTYKQTRCASVRQEKVLEHETLAERRQRASEVNRRKMQMEKEEHTARLNEEAEARSEQYHAQLQESRQKRVAAAIDGEYTVTGMSKKEVRMALGDPTSVSIPNSSMGRATELWVYRTRHKTDYVNFENGRVVSKSGHSQ